jgi:hypothetical protein
MKRISQIRWNDGHGLSDLSEWGTYPMARLVDILDDELNSLDVDMKLDEAAHQRMLFVADELRGKIEDLEEAFDRLQREINAPPAKPEALARAEREYREMRPWLEELFGAVGGVVGGVVDAVGGAGGVGGVETRSR